MKQTQLKYVFLFLILNCALFSSAQLAHFQNITMGDGLSNSFVNSIKQDKYGFIWIGTNNGLNIYDGIQFRHFFSDAKDKTSIPGNNIQKILFDGDSVWVGTRTGLGLMDVISKKCKTIDLGLNTEVRTLLLEKDKRILWVGTNSGLIKYTINSGEMLAFNTNTSNISHNIIRSLYKDNDGNLWIATFDKLNKLIANSNVFEVVDLKKDYHPKINNNLVLSILPNTSENDTVLWIGTQTGLVHFNRFTHEMRFFREENSGLSSSSIKALLKTSSEKLWIGTDFGLGEMNSNFEIQLHLHDPFKNNSLVNSTVWDVFEDHSGTIWFGTSNGISILSNASDRFQFYPMTFNQGKNISGYEIRDVIGDSKNNFWLATQFGVVKYNLEKQQKETFSSEQPDSRKLDWNDTKSTFEDSKGRVWIATNGGLVIWNPKTKQLKNYTADFGTGSGLRSNYISNIYELKNKTILVNTHNGLHRVVENNGEIQFEYIGKIDPFLVEYDQFLWSFDDAKLWKTNTKTFETIEEFNFHIDGKKTILRSILFTEKNMVWLGVDNGLIKYNLVSKALKFFEIKSNKSFVLISLLADDAGNIWAASHSAILKFSPETEVFEIYHSGDEIPISRFSRGCCLKRENGDLIFGGHDGFIKFSPEYITKSDFISPVKYTRLYISNKVILPGKEVNGKIILENEIAFTKNLALEYASGSFSLEFSSLHYGKRDGIRYAYKLDGADLEWNYINGTIGLATYSNLGSGKYIMRVKGTNNDGVWNENETLLNITIKPPLWASLGFIALYGVLFVLLIMALVYYYSQRSKMRNKLRIVKLEKDHAENLAKARQQFFANISHELATPLSLIIGPTEKLGKSSELNQTSKKFVRIIENNARRLLWLNNQLLDFRKLENKTLNLRVSEFGIIEFTKKVFSLFTDKAERKQIKYTFHTDIEHLEVQMDLRKIETILFNLLSNAFKFTPKGGEISVSISSCGFNSENSLCISVKDSGVGVSEDDQQKIFKRFYQAKEAIKMERGSGIGLTLVSEYAKMHRGKVMLNSQLGKGSEFQVILPLNLDYSSDKLIEIEQETNATLLKSEKNKRIEEPILNSTSGYPFVLLVEDDKEISDFIQISFKKKYTVRIAANGKEAFQIISKYIPDLIISDLVMPEMDGIEFTKKIKNNPKTSHIPLILLTGKSDKENQIEGLKSGADAYITKPFEIDLLEIRIDNFLKREIQFSEYLKFNKLSKPKEIHIESQDEKLLGRVVTCIEKYIADSDLNIDKVCNEIGLSHSVLYRKIKSLTGQTVNEFIRTVRVRRAEQLLRTKKFTVSEVAYETGFSNHSYFTKCFKKLHKMTPTEFIEQL